MTADLNMLAQKLETDRETKVVVFQLEHPEIFVAHADTNFLKDMSATAAGWPAKPVMQSLNGAPAIAGRYWR